VITKLQYEMMAQLRYSLRKFFQFSEQAATDAGSTPQQYQALLAIKGFPDRDVVTIGELAEQLQIRHHSAVGLANRLVSEGYARRIAGVEDRRQVFLGLTPQGEALLLRLARIHQEQWRQIAPHLESLLAKIRNQAHAGKPAAKRKAGSKGAQTR
jgi:DNA-binding MarR family transcriptional regulator